MFRILHEYSNIIEIIEWFEQRIENARLFWAIYRLIQ